MLRSKLSDLIHKWLGQSEDTDIDIALLNWISQNFESSDWVSSQPSWFTVSTLSIVVQLLHGGGGASEMRCAAAVCWINVALIINYDNFYITVSRGAGPWLGPAHWS